MEKNLFTFTVIILLMLDFTTVDVNGQRRQGRRRSSARRRRVLGSEETSTPLVPTPGELILEGEKSAIMDMKEKRLLTSSQVESFQSARSLKEFMFYNSLSLATDAKAGSSVAIEVDGKKARYFSNPHSGTCGQEMVSVCNTDLKQRETLAVSFPQCVKIGRCGGCSCQGGRVCTPVKEETWIIQAISISKRVKRTLDMSKSYNIINITMQHHLECECQCEVMEQECQSQFHVFDPLSCRCDCKNSDARTECKASKIHVWNQEQCKCLCKHKKEECGSGFEFNDNECKCVPNESNFFSSDLDLLSFP